MVDVRGDLAGDASTFDAFARRERLDSLRLAWFLTRDRLDAEDVVQLALLKVGQRFESLANPAAYLRVVVLNGCRQLARRRRTERDRAHGAEPGAPGPSGRQLPFQVTLIDPQVAPRRHHEQRRDWRAGRVAVAAAVIVGLVGMAAWFGSSRHHRVAPAAIPSDAPVWYRLLRPLLPDGFDRAAASVAGPIVHFFIFNKHGDQLVATMVREPMPPDPSGKDLPKTVDHDGTWFEQGGSYNLVTTAGLIVDAGCASDGGTCHVAGGGVLTGTALRQFVSDLAHQFPVAELPAASSGRANTSLVDAGRHLLDARLTGETLWVDAPMDATAAFQFIHWNGPPSSTDDNEPFASLYVTGGLYPRPTTTVRASSRSDDGTTQIETAFLPSGTVIRVATNDPAHLSDIGPVLDQLIAPIG